MYSLIISFLWGIVPIIHKMLLNELNNITVMAITAFFYFILLLFLIFYNKKVIITDLNKITNDQYIWIFIATFFGVFITNFLYYYVIKNGKTPIVIALMYTCPVVTLVATYYLLKDKINNVDILGILLIVTGILCIFLK
jgi:drug/metabolite transporter (DMT)-like permease